MVSDFRKKKYLYIFNKFYDTNKSGSLDKMEFFTANANVAAKRGYKPGDVVYDLVRDWLFQIWNGMVGAGDKDGDGILSAEEWVKMWDEYAKNPAAAPEWQQLFCKCVYQLIDATNDGAIDANEFAAVFESFSIPKAKSVEAFGKISKGKATINWEEFQALWNEYFTSENPADPGNYIFAGYE